MQQINKTSAGAALRAGRYRTLTNIILKPIINTRMTEGKEGQLTRSSPKIKDSGLKSGIKRLQSNIRRSVRQLEDFSDFQGKVAGVVEEFFQQNPLLEQNMLSAYKTTTKINRRSLPIVYRMGMDYYLKEKEGIELDEEKTGIREKLWRAYDESFQGQSRINSRDELFGGITYYGISYDKNTEKDARVELARKQIIPSEELTEEYKKHGMAKIDIPLHPRHVLSMDGPIIIDTLPFADPKPRCVWMGLQPESLTIFVSSGKQTPPKDCGEIYYDDYGNLEGFALMFNYRTNPSSEIPYRPNLFFLYSPEKR